MKAVFIKAVFLAVSWAVMIGRAVIFLCSARKNI